MSGKWRRAASSSRTREDGRSRLVSQIFYIKGNELIGANRAGLFINLVPIFGTLLSVLIVGEQFQFYQGLALALVLGGIALAEYSGSRAVL